MKKLMTLGLLLFLFACKKMDMAEPGLLVPKTVDEDSSLPSITVNNAMFHSETFGNPDSPMLVIIHGGPGGDYRSLLNCSDFADNGFFIVFYDQRGAGLSQRFDESTYTVQLMIDDLGAVINHYKESPNQKVFLIGHSWGAMLATAFVNQHPEDISGAVLAEPGGLTWTQTQEYLSRSNAVKFFNEALNDAIYPEQIFDGRSEHEILDYKASFFSSYENAPGNVIGNAGPYPFWRNGAVSMNACISYAEKYSFDFTTNLSNYQTTVLFAYSELNTAYGYSWAQQVSEPFPEAELIEVKGSGHEMLYFGWNDFYPQTLEYLNKLK